MTTERLAQLRRVLAAGSGDGRGQIEALLVTSPENRFYITGFTGSSGYVLVSADEALLLTDFRYVEQAAAQAPQFEVVRHGSPWHEILRERVEAMGIRELGFEREHTSVAECERIGQALGDVKLIGVSDLLEKLRLIKDASELQAVRAAVACADTAFSDLLGSGVIRPGVEERLVAAELEHRMRLAGSTKPAFDTIVASGPRSSLPHGRASERLLCEGDFVTFDFGAIVGGYCSDMTRTVVIGKAGDEQRAVYDLVLSAQLAGVEAVRAGRAGREVDAAARDIIAAAGHGDHFGHGLGHGVGIAIHEPPRLSPVGDTVLAEGMLTSVEPGVYVPGWGGVRIEDLVYVTADGCEVLTKTPKDLLELGWRAKS
jgi:Xaa-Pro aminopeptidase